jgi:hypothetical protein
MSGLNNSDYDKLSYRTQILILCIWIYYQSVNHNHYTHLIFCLPCNFVNTSILLKNALYIIYIIIFK